MAKQHGSCSCYLITPPGILPETHRCQRHVRKYVKRERKKTLPEGVDYWDFACKVGQGTQPPAVKHLEEVVSAIDEAAATDCESVYVEILAIPGVRRRD